MARPLRVEFDQALFHVTARGNERGAIVRDDQDRERWLEWVVRVVERHRLEVFSFALLDNHYHLFLETPHGGLSRAMQTLNGSYTSYFNRHHRRVGHLSQGRFKAILVEREGHYAELSRDVHLNPIRAGIVAKPEDSPWSSFRGYYRARWMLDWVDYDRVLSEFGSDGSRARRAYRQFVEGGLASGVTSPLRDAVHGFILGGDRFVARIEELVLSRPDDGSMPELRALRSGPALEEIVAATVKSYGTDQRHVLQPGRGQTEARDVAIYLARELTGARLREIGAAFAGLSQPSVSLAASRIAQRLQSDRALSQRLADIRKTIATQTPKLCPQELPGAQQNSAESSLRAGHHGYRGQVSSVKRA